MTRRHSKTDPTHAGRRTGTSIALARTAFPLLVGAGAASTAALAAPQGVFDAGRIVPGALGVPSGVVASDVDGDGRPDVIASEGTSGIVMIFRDRGGADFERGRVLFDAGNPIGGIAAGDIDSDGDVDLVVATVSRVVSAWRNDGAGNFSLASQSGLLGGPAGPASLVDVNSDGALDIVVETVLGSLSVDVLLGNGAGAFAAPSGLVDPPTALVDVEFVDADQDGDLDVFARRLVPSSPDQLVLVENTGVYPFRPADIVDVGAAASLVDSFHALRAFDADGDGDVDVALSLGGFSQLGWIANLGGGAFSSVQAFGSITGAPAQGVNRLYAVDFDNDGLQDLVFHRTVGNFDGELRLVQSFGGGAFQDLGRLGGTRRTNVALTSAVLDGATFPALVSASGFPFNIVEDPARVEVYPGSVNGFTGPEPPLNDSVGRAPLLSIDADQDGRDDVLSLDTAGQGLVVLRSLGNGAFADTETIVPPGQSSAVTLAAYAIADANVDGFDDVVFLRNSSGQSSIHARHGQAGGGLAAEVLLLASVDLPPLVDAILLADLNADGATDLLVTSLFGGRVDVALNRGDGSFDPASRILPFNLSIEAPIRFGDVDGDGDVDLLLGLVAGVHWLENDGSANFANPALLVRSTDGFLRYAVGDVDGDGRLDVAYTEVATGGGSFARDLLWVRGISGHSFGPPQTIAANVEAPFQLILRDIDLDGRVDVCFSETTPAGTRYRLALATVSGAFAAPVTIVVGSTDPDPLLEPAFLDANGDGAVDLAIGSTRDTVFGVVRPRFSLMLNLSLGEVGIPYCDPAVPNASGASGSLSAFGSERVDVNQLTLRASSLPIAAPGYLLTSLTRGMIGTVPNSVGTLCLAGAVGRFVGPGQIQFAGPSGAFGVEVDLGTIPQPGSGFVSVVAGETWNFQVWYRDSILGMSTSNFTSVLAVTFR